MRFSDLVGIDPAVAVMQRALAANAVSGAYLLSGPDGVGKTSLALAFATAAACKNPIGNPPEACGECASCRLAAQDQQPEIVTISPAGEATQIWQFWDRDGKPVGALQRTLQFRPSIGRRRVFIIERADTLTESAANSLLKALEETPEYVSFLLLTPQISRMLPTIISRCRQVRVPLAGVRKVTEFLVRTRGLSEARAITWATLGEGAVGRAVRLADQPGSEEEMGKVMDLVDSLVVSPPLRACKLSEEIRAMASSLTALVPADNKTTTDADTGKERASRKKLNAVLDLLIVAFRDLLAISAGGADVPITHEEERSRLVSLSSSRPFESWEKIIDALLTARRRVDQNVTINLITDALAARIAVG